MTISPLTRWARKAPFAAVSALLLVGFTFGTAATSPVAAQAATSQGPCDIYATAGTPCVAAHSTTRALYAAYDGSLYQVQRASDSGYLNIGVLSAGGVADAAAQDAFCANKGGVPTTAH